jgi:hypothetical protein
MSQVIAWHLRQSSPERDLRSPGRRDGTQLESPLVAGGASTISAILTARARGRLTHRVPGFRYYAVSSNGGGTVGASPTPGAFQTGREFLNLIDLSTFRNTQLEIPMNNIGEDLTPSSAATR